MNTDESAPEIRLGAMLRAERLKLGLTQKQVEARSGGVLSQNYISQVERGVVALPGFDMLEAFAAALGLSPNDLKIVAGYPTVTMSEQVIKGGFIPSGSELFPATMIAAPPPNATAEVWEQFWLSYPGDPPKEAVEAIEAIRRRRREAHDAEQGMGR